MQIFFGLDFILHPSHIVGPSLQFGMSQIIVHFEKSKYKVCNFSKFILNNYKYVWKWEIEMAWLELMTLNLNSNAVIARPLKKLELQNKTNNVGGME